MPYKFSVIVPGDSSPRVHQRVLGDESRVQELLALAKINCNVKIIKEFLTVGEEWVKTNPRDVVFISDNRLYYGDIHELGCQWQEIPADLLLQFVDESSTLEEAADALQEYYRSFNS